MGQLEQYIKDSDVDGFWGDRDMRDWYLKFLHTYGVCAKDKTLIKDQIEKENKSIYDVVTLSDQAFVVLIYVNNHDGWSEKRRTASGLGDKVRYQCMTRWTRRSKGGDSGLYGNGWAKEGMDFFVSAEQFFGLLHEDEVRDGELRTEAASWWARNVRGEVDNVPPLSDGSMNVSLARLCYSISGKYRKKSGDVDASAEEETDTVDTGYGDISIVVGV